LSAIQAPNLHHPGGRGKYKAPVTALVRDPNAPPCAMENAAAETDGDWWKSALVEYGASDD